MSNWPDSRAVGFGMHLMADLEDCDPATLEDLRLVHDTLGTLCVTIGMKALTAPYAFFYDGGDDPRGSGITGFQVIAESHISIHTFPHMRHAFADVFSCRPFDAEVAARMLKGVFRCSSARLQIAGRGKNFVWEAGVDPVNLEEEQQ